MISCCTLLFGYLHIYRFNMRTTQGSPRCQKVCVTFKPLEFRINHPQGDSHSHQGFPIGALPSRILLGEGVFSFFLCGLDWTRFSGWISKHMIKLVPVLGNIRNPSWKNQFHRILNHEPCQKVLVPIVSCFRCSPNRSLWCSTDTIGCRPAQCDTANFQAAQEIRDGQEWATRPCVRFLGSFVWWLHPGKLTYRRQKWPYLKGVTFSKPSFWVSM